MATPGRLALLRTKAWVGGSWRGALSEATFPVYNPAKGELIAEVPDMGPEDVNIAVQDAYTNQRTWAAYTVKERSAVLKKLNDLMIANKEELASIVSLESGKPFQEAQAEVVYGASYIEWFSEEAKRIDGDIIPSHPKGRRSLVIKQPVGVAALITPWNFPVAMITRKTGAALAAGCSAIVKPSEETPLSALALAELSSQAGVPAGVFNVITSSHQSTPSVGQALTDNELVGKLSFTGSTAVGKGLMAQCASTVKSVSLELGGNAPMIVFNSANVETAVKGCMIAKFRNTGQTCISANRILVQSGIHDQFVKELSVAIGGLKQGDPFDEGVNLGPLINKKGVEKVESHVTDAVSKGAEVLMGGARNNDLGELFYQPSLLVGGNLEMRFALEETFGPVAPIVRFEDEEEAIAIANATPFGLAGYFYSTDMSQIWRVSEALECGLVGVNEALISNETVPFGGYKQSGLGREGSKYGIQDYLELKYICMGDIKEREC